MPYDVRPRSRDADKMAEESIREGERFGLFPPVKLDEDADPNQQPRERDYRATSKKRSPNQDGPLPFKIVFP